MLRLPRLVKAPATVPQAPRRSVAVSTGCDGVWPCVRPQLSCRSARKRLHDERTAIRNSFLAMDMNRTRVQSRSGWVAFRSIMPCSTRLCAQIEALFAGGLDRPSISAGVVNAAQSETTSETMVLYAAMKQDYHSRSVHGLFGSSPCPLS
jgi:hypothetical protein